MIQFLSHNPKVKYLIKKTLSKIKYLDRFQALKNISDSSRSTVDMTAEHPRAADYLEIESVVD